MFAVLEGRLFGSPYPAEEDAEDLRKNRIGLVVSLTARTPPRPFLDALRSIKARHLHEPVPDFTPPSIAQMDRIYAAAREAFAGGGAVLVHCGAGLGRTGTVLACLLAAEEGLPAAQAVRRVREARPGAVETSGQERFVSEWLARFRGGGPGGTRPGGRSGGGTSPRT